MLDDHRGGGHASPAIVASRSGNDALPMAEYERTAQHRDAACVGRRLLARAFNVVGLRHLVGLERHSQCARRWEEKLMNASASAEKLVPVTLAAASESKHS